MSSIELLSEGSVLTEHGLSEVQPTWTHSHPSPDTLVLPQTSWPLSELKGSLSNTIFQTALEALHAMISYCRDGNPVKLEPAKISLEQILPRKHTA